MASVIIRTPMKPRIYTDTSVIGGCLDQEFHGASNALLAAFCEGSKIILISDLMLFELSKAPEKVRAVLDRVPEANREYLSLSDAAMDLADEYIAAGAIGPGMREDAQHVALASVERADLLVSWNFKHIVKYPAYPCL
uniref:PIN domain-containing protein n=1 Tax=Candidatus Kentrum eta TaxID=2126337 RepID=A0A450UQQ8_9GAMM|nr:MAG: hypothetical protein BECKH772A_GA0070896_1000810 [Candidatus Kentron sp. H]VFJ93560.1 MAG: hypothetical protein BECKH772B_GA0070898_1004618 [Candidatus Kentron sp. H]VFJ94881.1 MAG: hypothetical protein BECKH772C_GA0070978_1000138 [Candidatus Kentron sp. H]